MNRRSIPLLAMLVVLLTPSIAGAQRSFPEPDVSDPFEQPQSALVDTLAVSIELSESSGGNIDITGIEGFSTDEQYGLARRIGDDLGLSRDAYDVPSPEEQFTFEDFEDLPDQRLVLDDRLPVREGNNWRLDLDTTELLRTADLHGFESVELSVCTAPVEVEDKSSRPPDAVDGNCRTWELPVGAASPVTISLLEQPEPQRYWTFVGIFAAVSVALSLLAVPLALLARRHVFSTLSGLNIAMVLFLVGLAMFCVMVSAIVLATVDRPISDIVLGAGLSTWGHAMAIILPAFLSALPAIVIAVVLARAKPPSFATARSTPPPPPSPPAQPQAQPYPSSPAFPPQAKPQPGNVEPATAQQEREPEDERRDPPAGPTWHAPS